MHKEINLSLKISTYNLNHLRYENDLIMQTSNNYKAVVYKEINNEAKRKLEELKQILDEVEFPFE